MAVANLALRFVVELVGVGFVGYWAFGLTDGPVLRFVAAGLAIAAFVAVWGLLLAPNANSGLSQPQKDLLGTVVLLVAARRWPLPAIPRSPAGTPSSSSSTRCCSSSSARTRAASERRSERLTREGRQIECNLLPRSIDSAHRAWSTAISSRTLARSRSSTPACAAIGTTCIASSRRWAARSTDIRALLLTHGDVDHVGFAERLRQRARRAGLRRAADAAEARGEAIQARRRPRDPMRTGADGRLPRCTAHPRWLRERHRSRRSQPIDGAINARVPGAPAVIPLPGHTPGSVAYHLPSVDAIFMGDAMTTRSVTSGDRRTGTGAVHRRPGGRRSIARRARRAGGRLGPARAWRRVERRAGGGAPAYSQLMGGAGSLTCHGDGRWHQA